MLAGDQTQHFKPFLEETFVSISPKRFAISLQCVSLWESNESMFTEHLLYGRASTTRGRERAMEDLLPSSFPLVGDPSETKQEWTHPMPSIICQPSFR